MTPTLCTSLVGVKWEWIQFAFPTFRKLFLGKPCMKIDSLVSLLAGTIEVLYKEASHTSHTVSETLSRAPDSPRPYRTKSQSRYRRSPPRPRPPARRTCTRAARAADVRSRADRSRTRRLERVQCRPQGSQNVHLHKRRTRGVSKHAANAANTAARAGIRVWDGLGVG